MQNFPVTGPSFRWKAIRCEEQPQEGKTSVILNQNYDLNQNWERGSSFSSVSFNTELKKARRNEEQTNSVRKEALALNSKLNGEYGKQLCEAA